LIIQEAPIDSSWIVSLKGWENSAGMEFIAIAQAEDTVIMPVRNYRSILSVVTTLTKNWRKFRTLEMKVSSTGNLQTDIRQTPEDLINFGANRILDALYNGESHRKVASDLRRKMGLDHPSIVEVKRFANKVAQTLDLNEKETSNLADAIIFKKNSFKAYVLNLFSGKGKKENSLEKEKKNLLSQMIKLREENRDIYKKMRNTGRKRIKSVVGCTEFSKNILDDLDRALIQKIYNIVDNLQRYHSDKLPMVKPRGNSRKAGIAASYLYCSGILDHLEDEDNFCFSTRLMGNSVLIDSGESYITGEIPVTVKSLDMEQGLAEVMSERGATYSLKLDKKLDKIEEGCSLVVNFRELNLLTH